LIIIGKLHQHPPNNLHQLSTIHKCDNEYSENYCHGFGKAARREEEKDENEDEDEDDTILAFKSQTGKATHFSVRARS
jgi:hypothetical protein